MSAPKLGTKSVKGMIIHHATTRLGWTWDEASEAFDEWFGECSAHRERVESTLTPESAEPSHKVSDTPGIEPEFGWEYAAEGREPINGDMVRYVSRVSIEDAMDIAAAECPWSTIYPVGRRPYQPPVEWEPIES